MSEETTLYVVTSGEYDDYGIEALFSTLEAAEAYCHHHNADPHREQCAVEEWGLDLHADRYLAGEGPWHLVLQPDGTVDRVRTGGSGNYTRFQSRFYRRGEAPLPPLLCLGLWAKDREQAIKLAQEQHAAQLALGAWPTATELPL